VTACHGQRREEGKGSTIGVQQALFNRQGPLLFEDGCTKVMIQPDQQKMTRRHHDLPTQIGGRLPDDSPGGTALRIHEPAEFQGIVCKSVGGRVYIPSPQIPDSLEKASYFQYLSPHSLLLNAMRVTREWIGSLNHLLQFPWIIRQATHLIRPQRYLPHLPVGDDGHRFSGEQINGRAAGYRRSILGPGRQCVRLGIQVNQHQKPPVVRLAAAGAYDAVTLSVLDHVDSHRMKKCPVDGPAGR
jgi:hypothetical protein